MKTIELKLTEEKARSLYPAAPTYFKEVLEENFGKALFATDPMERFQEFTDILAYHGITPADFDQQCQGLAPDEVAYRQIKLIVAAYNDGWEPDWNDSDEWKHCPYFRMGGSAAGFSVGDLGLDRERSFVGSRLVYREEEHARDAANKFLPIYKAFFTS